MCVSGNIHGLHRRKRRRNPGLGHRRTWLGNAASALQRTNRQEQQPLLADVIDEGRSAYEASADLQFAAAVAELGMLLRNSPHKGTANWDDVFQLARVSQGADLDGTRTEFITLAEAAKRLK
jgi:hypothetical protein